MKSTQLLPDHIRPDVQILFVGINPGLRSAEVGHHYAGHSNRFWKLLYASKCVPIPLTYHDDWRLPDSDELRGLIAGHAATEPGGQCKLTIGGNRSETLFRACQGGAPGAVA